jgi:Ca-activated chloride channel family protein
MLTFANTLGLLGLLSLPLIAVLHMLRERQRRYVVSSLHLWAFLEPEVRGSRFRKVPLTLLFILDMAIATLLCLALARPQVRLDLPLRDTRHSVILLDVSTSMLARDVIPSRFSQATIDIAAQLNSLGPRDTATLITFGNRAHWIADTRQDGLQEILSQLNQIQAGETGAALDEALAIGLAALEGYTPATFHIYSDGAIPDISLDTFEYPLEWHTYGKVANNQAVLDLSISAIEQDRYQAYVQIANFASSPTSRVLSFLVDDVPLESQSINLPADSLVSYLSPPIHGKPQDLIAILAGGDDLKEDDFASSGLPPSGAVKVLLVADTLYPLRQAIESIPDAVLQVIAPADYATYPAIDVTFFREIWPASLPDGLTVIFEPPTANTGNTPAWINDAKHQIKADAAMQQDSQTPLLKDVDFSGVRWVEAWGVNEIPQGYTVLLQADDTPLILLGNEYGKELLLILADLNVGNFTRHPAFPILIGNVIRQAQAAPFPSSLHTGQDIELPQSDEYQALTIQPPSGDAVTFQTGLPTQWSDTITPGLYHFEYQNRAGKVTLYICGINAGDAYESDLTPQNWIRNLDTMTGPSSTSTGTQQLELRPWLLGLALLFLLWEARLAWH